MNKKFTVGQIIKKLNKIHTWGIKYNCLQVNGQFSWDVTWSGVSMNDLDWTSARIQSFRVKYSDVIGSVIC